MVISRAAALTACYAGTLGTLQLANPRCRALSPATQVRLAHCNSQTRAAALTACYAGGLLVNGAGKTNACCAVACFSAAPLHYSIYYRYENSFLEKVAFLLISKYNA